MSDHQQKNGSPHKNGGRSRPSSLYDNFGDINSVMYQMDDYTNAKLRFDDSSLTNDQIIDDSERDRSPTQEFLLKTTVPQNLAATNLAGRHTPTRNSLRHSRMIVMNRTGTSNSRSHQPPIIIYQRLATVLVALQTIFGASICCLSAWLLIWTPNLRKRDNPYWSGLPLLASGTVGLLLLCCIQRDHPRTLKGYFINGAKVFSVFLSLTAAAASLIASVFALIHILTLAVMQCELKIQLNETCFCQMNPNSTYPIKSYHYADLKCTDVDNLFTILLIFSCCVNVVAGLISLWYVYLHCSTKYNYLYSKVRTKDQRSISFSKQVTS